MESRRLQYALAVPTVAAGVTYCRRLRHHRNVDGSQRRRRVKVVGVVLILLVLAASSAIVETIHGARAGWLVALMLGTATVGVGLARTVFDAHAAPYLERPRLRALEQREIAMLLRRLPGAGEDLPLVRDIDVGLLGIHPSIPLEQNAQAGLSTQLPLYVRRDIDQDMRSWLASRLDAGGFCLLVGHAAAGKTRCAYEAVLDVFRDWRFAMPANGTEINDLVERGALPPKTVVWLDEIQNFLTVDAVSLSTVRCLLADRTRPVLLIGTIWPERFDRLTASAADDRDEARSILSLTVATASAGAVARRFEVGTFTDAERDRAGLLAKRDSRLARAMEMRDAATVPEALAAAPALAERWRQGANQYGVAVISAAVVARRAGHPEPVPDDVLQPLAAAILTSEQRAAVAADWFQNALVWACTRVKGASAPLTPVATTAGAIDGYRVSDVLVQLDFSGATASTELPERLVEVASPHACQSIGWTWYRAGKRRAAGKAFAKAADAGYADAMHGAGRASFELGDFTSAESWFRQASEAGHPRAMAALGMLLIDQEEPEEAQAWLKRGAAAGSAAAAMGLGQFLDREGKAPEAAGWFRAAAEGGNPMATLAAGFALELDGDAAGAASWYERISREELAEAANNLGFHLEDVNRLADAERWYRTGAEAGSGYAMNNLAECYSSRGQMAEAEFWYRKGAEAGNSYAMVHLGEMFQARGEAADAEHWYRLAAGSEGWYRKRVELGAGRAMANLAKLLAAQGRTVEAEEWLRTGADIGNIEAARSLGALSRSRSGPSGPEPGSDPS